MDGYSKIDQALERSDEVREVMTHIPHWIIRWGMTCIFLTVVIFLGLSWLIKYPDVLTSNVVLTTANPPARLVARASGKIMHLAYKENEQVTEGAILGIIENPANSKEVLDLINTLQAVPYADLVQDQNLDLPDNINLGELQKDYALFYRAYNELALFKKLDPVAKEIISTRQDVQEYTNLLANQQKEKSISKTEVGLVQKDYDRNVTLYKDKVIADKQLEDNERELIRTRRSFEQLETSIASTRIRLSELQKALTLLQIQNQEKQKQYELNLTEAYKTLSGALANWEQKYLLKAPVAGKLTYLKFWSSNQFVNAGDEVMVIVPDKQEAVIGKVLMPIQNSGKVKTGQKVNIYLQNFPFEEFGTVHGQVKSISLVPKDNLYAIEITLPQGLKTSYNKNLVFKQEMQGNAEIITEDLRLMERVFYQLKSLGEHI